jgi:hypothetical protein
MISQKQSASTPSFASTMLPSGNVIVLPTAKRVAPPRGTFTKTAIAKMRCPPGKDEQLFWDRSCGGFGLRALASGRRTRIYQYRDEHMRTRRIALGDVSAVTLDAARLAARQHAASVTQGANPSAERNANKSAASVLNVIKAYLRHANTSGHAHTKRPNDIFLSMRFLYTTTGRRRSGALISRHCLSEFRTGLAPLQQTASGRRLVRSGRGVCVPASSNPIATR